MANMWKTIFFFYQKKKILFQNSNANFYKLQITDHSSTNGLKGLKFYLRRPLITRVSYYKSLLLCKYIFICEKELQGNSGIFLNAIHLAFISTLYSQESLTLLNLNLKCQKSLTLHLTILFLQRDAKTF